MQMQNCCSFVEKPALSTTVNCMVFCLYNDCDENDDNYNDEYHHNKQQH